MKPASSTRNPDRTREALIEAAFEEIHKNGFRAADVKEILATAGLTKGALYHHFGSKKGLGQAVLDEAVREYLLDAWVRPLRNTDDPLGALAEIFDQGAVQAEEFVVHGCPLNNLAQEMTPIDDDFRRGIRSLYELWKHTFVESLARGQRTGTVRSDIDPESTGTFLLASCQGAISLAKGMQSVDTFKVVIAGAKRFLETLRPSFSSATTSSKEDS